MTVRTCRCCKIMICETSIKCNYDGCNKRFCYHHLLPELGKSRSCYNKTCFNCQEETKNRQYEHTAPEKYDSYFIRNKCPNLPEACLWCDEFFCSFHEFVLDYDRGSKTNNGFGEWIIQTICKLCYQPLDKCIKDSMSIWDYQKRDVDK